ncbi:MAG: HEPN domain-containing protein [Candidatus Omnitrophota bacterium]|nr:HEPN domain-containing protein [Candidatus Omnitrophota bacterium]
MKEINNWFKFAKDDLKVAELILKEEIFNQVCFHSQQVVEKVLKGYLSVEHKIIPKIHSLNDLLNLCIEINKDFSNLIEMCFKLDKYYIPVRYPDALPGILPEGLPQEKDAIEAISFAKKIMRFVKAKLKK